ncbi:unnamed protein product [Adineta ricciae]|uniref:Uncharacterized protein n=1 Tax=Adineta ricciae TaxID=249248 RepID=A0A815PQA4_ADIRI|nr:unnamed protein product [Adineta ricciae]
MASRRNRDVTDRIRRMERGHLSEEPLPRESTTHEQKKYSISQLISHESVPKATKEFFDECKEYYHLTQKPLVSAPDEIFRNESECTPFTMTMGVDREPEELDLDGFVESIQRICNFKDGQIQPVSIKVKPLLVELKLNQRDQSFAMPTVKIVYSKLTDETLNEFYKMGIFVLILGSCRSLEKQQEGRKKLMMDARYNRTYGPNHTFWKGPLDDGRDRGIDFNTKFKGWCICYHGTQFQNGLSILLSGLRPAKDVAHGPGIYTSPSIIYTSHPRYAEVKYIDSETKFGFLKSKHYIQFVLECRVHPKDIKVACETLLLGDAQIDTNIDNSAIEWVVNNYGKKLVDFNDPDASIVCTGVMVRITDRHPALLPESGWWFKAGVRNSSKGWKEFYKTLESVETERQTGVACSIILE